MSFPRHVLVLLVAAVAPAWAQSASSLNLALPADPVPTQAAVQPQRNAEASKAPTATADATATRNSAAVTAATQTAPAPMLPSMYDAGDDGSRAAAARACDDSTYGKAQVHGSVGMGVVAGNRGSGNYETGTVEVTKALGGCDDPKGLVDVSISVGQGNFDRRRHGRRHDAQGQ